MARGSRLRLCAWRCLTAPAAREGAWLEEAASGVSPASPGACQDLASPWQPAKAWGKVSASPVPLSRVPPLLQPVGGRSQTRVSPSAVVRALTCSSPDLEPRVGRKWPLLQAWRPMCVTEGRVPQGPSLVAWDSPRPVGKGCASTTARRPGPLTAVAQGRALSPPGRQDAFLRDWVPFWGWEDRTQTSVAGSRTRSCAAWGRRGSLRAGGALGRGACAVTRPLPGDRRQGGLAGRLLSHQLPSGSRAQPRLPLDGRPLSCATARLL